MVDGAGLFLVLELLVECHVLSEQDVIALQELIEEDMAVGIGFLVLHVASLEGEGVCEVWHGGRLIWYGLSGWRVEKRRESGDNSLFFFLLLFFMPSGLGGVRKEVWLGGGGEITDWIGFI